MGERLTFTCGQVHIPLIRGELKALLLYSLDDLVGRLGTRPAGCSIHSKVRPAIVFLVFELRIIWFPWDLVRLVQTEQEDQRLGLLRVELLDQLAFGPVKRPRACKGLDVVIVDISEAVLALVHQRREFVQEEDPRRRV